MNVRNTIRHIVLLTVMLLFVSTADAQTMREQLLNYLDNYTRAEQLLKRSKLDSLVVDTTTQHIRVYVSGGFMEQYFTDEVVEDVYANIRSFVPDSLSSYPLTVITDRQPIEQLVPNTIRKGAIDKSRIWQSEYKGQPWVRNVSTPLSAAKGLKGNHIALWHSHGTYWKQEKKAWTWQRPHLFCTTEDLFSQTFVIPYIIPMLENAGAVVYTPRDRDWQNNEVVIDNDAPEKDGIYQEEGRWHTCDSAGFAHLKDAYYMGDHPFSDGTAR